MIHDKLLLCITSLHLDLTSAFHHPGIVFASKLYE
jgi:hypothetical protein